MTNFLSITELQPKEAGGMASGTRHKLERLWWGGLASIAGAGCTGEGWETIQGPWRYCRQGWDMRTPGSTVVWVLWGLTAQICRILGFMDPAAHSIVRCFFNSDICFRDAHLSNVLKFGLKDTQRPKLSKLYSTSPTSAGEIKQKQI